MNAPTSERDDTRSASLRRHLLASALVLVAATACRGDRDLGGDTRELGRWEVGGVELSLDARWSGRHIGAHMGPEYRWVEAANIYLLSWKVQGPELRLAQTLDERSRNPLDEAAAVASLAALSVEACVRDEALVYRVTDSGAERAAPWRVAYVTESAVLEVDAPSQAGTCDQVLAASATWDEWLRDHGQGEAACTVAKQTGKLPELIRCSLRGAGGPTWVNESEQAREVHAVLPPAEMADPDLAAALFEVLDPGSDFVADGVTAAGYVLHTPDPSAQLAWITRVGDHCASQGCAPWRAEAAAMVARELATPEACGPMAKAAAKLLERGADEAAMKAIGPVAGCAPVDEVAPVMREGLTHRTDTENTLPDPLYSSYDSIDSNCNDTSVTQGGPHPGAMSTLCTRMPRMAGSWLARHCDDATVAAASAAAATASGDYDPRTDMVFDGALRVLGSCDPAAFELAIANAPDLPAEQNSADARGKAKLRMLFLRDAPAPTR